MLFISGKAQGRQKVLLFLVLTIQMVSTPWEKSCRLQDGASHFIAFKFRKCMALPGVKFLSNPRRMHSREEGEEKEEQELPRAPSCCSTTPTAPFPLPLHTRRAPTGLPGTRYQDTSPPPPPL